MTLEERLEHLILARYKSMKDFAVASGVPYTTIASILKRDVLKSGVNTMAQICKTLGISLDGLADGEIVPRDVPRLTVEEVKLIEKYRALDERGKRAVDETLEREFSYTKKFVEDSSIAAGTG